jgi:hypothetical protein
MSRKAEFLTPFEAKDISGDREVSRLKLLSPFRVYSDELDAEFTVPEGFEFDESIPGPLQGIVRPFGMSKRGACVHDWLYQNHGYQADDGAFVPVTREQADAVYREMLLAKGTPVWRANIRWFALRIGGWLAWRNAVAVIAMMLTSCANDIAGLSRDERLAIYGTVATVAGQPEIASIAYGLRRNLSSAKAPKNISP